MREGIPQAVTSVARTSESGSLREGLEVGRGMTRRWVRVGEVSGEGLPLVSRVLAARGVVEAGAAREFLEPTLKLLHEPSLMPGMDEAAERLVVALRGGERVVIYGDYDVDGISASAILYHAMKHLAPEGAVSTYVPHRIDEGYGLNSEAIEGLARDGARVIVSVDCGVTAVGPALVAKRCGVDLIVTDHHNPPARMEDLPEAFAVVHPRRPDSRYPFGELSGSAVAYKLAWRLMTAWRRSAKVGESDRRLLLELLGLASLGVIADVVPLVGENRVIAKFGLGRIKTSGIVGLRALVEASGLAGENVEAVDVGFKLGPRLNACGRLGHAREAVELLTVAGAERAGVIAGELTRLNDERRAVERRIAEEAAERAGAAGMTGDDRRAIVLADAEWHQGVVGIACSRLVGKFGRPTILMQQHGAECHGSGRSIDGFNLHAALEACREHLIGFGGHDMAAGVRVATERVPAFVEAFVAEANRLLKPADLVPTLRYDTDATLEELSEGTVGELAKLGPFGRSNPEVRVRLTGLRVAGRPKVMGSSGAHVSLAVKQAGRMMRVVGWDWAERLRDLPHGAGIDAVVVPKLSKFGGVVRVEGEVLDVGVG